MAEAISIPTTSHVTVGLVLLAKRRTDTEGRVGPIWAEWQIASGMPSLSLLPAAHQPLFSNLSLPWPPVYCARDKDVPQVLSELFRLLLAGFTLEAAIVDSAWLSVDVEHILPVT